MEPVEPQEQTSLNKVRKFYYRHKRMPSYREMARMLGYTSPNAVAYKVHKWIEEGVVRMEDRHLEPDDKFFSLPLLGVIKAGFPVADDFQQESVSLDQYLVGNPGFTFLLRVSGDSMINEGIREGDLVILDRKREPRNKDVIAAYIDNQWTLKYFNRNNGKVYLSAANPKYPPMFPQESLVTGGVVVSVIRKYY